MRALIAIAASLGACGDGGATTSPDAAAPDAELGTDVEGVPPGCVAGRAVTDRPDDHGFDQVRVLYVVPSDGIDRARDTDGRICSSVRGVATWFHDRAGVALRLDTMGGLVDLGFVRLAKPDAAMRGSDPNNTSVATGTAFVRERIELELGAMGQIAPNKAYAVYYEGSSSYACGGGAWPPVIIGRVGAMYLGGMPLGQTQSCGDIRPWGASTLVPNYVDYGMLHEMVHTLGFAPAAAPNEHASGHVFDASSIEPDRDLMYSPRVGQSDPAWNVDAAAGLLLDIGSDDYFASQGDPDLAASSLVAPLPAGARRPIGW